MHQRDEQKQLPTDLRNPSGWTWTQRSDEDLQVRLRIIRQAIYVNSLAQNRTPDEGESAFALATSFAYALENIPTHHLEECFQRAIKNNTSDFLLTAGAVNREYQELVVDLQQQAHEHAAKQENLLRAGYGSLGSLGMREWKERHNLPAEWRLGQNYPPESDLYNGPYPERTQTFLEPPPGSSWHKVTSPWKHG